MSIYRDNFLDDLYKIEAVEVFDEDTTYESSINEIGLTTAVTSVKIGIKAIKFVGTMAYNIKRGFDIEQAKEKLNKITRYYESEDEKFVSDYELRRKMFSVKRYFDGETEKQNEIKGIIKKFFFDKYYPDKAYTFFKGDKPVFTYFKCSDISTSMKIGADNIKAINSLKNSDSESSKSKLIGNAIPNSSISYTGNKFFFKLEDKKYEKYRYYYLSLACLDSEQMVTEAINWINREYDKIQKELNK